MRFCFRDAFANIWERSARIAMRTRLTKSIILISVSVLCGQSVRSHDLPPVVDEYRLLSSDWEVRSSSGPQPGETYFLQANHNGKTFQWKIEPGFVAQSLRGNAVQSDQVDGLTISHIQKMIGKTGGLMFKVASLTPGGPLFVRSMKLFDAHDSFERATKLGSPILNLESGEVRKIGFAEYEKRVAATAEKDWKQVETRH